MGSGRRARCAHGVARRNQRAELAAMGAALGKIAEPIPVASVEETERAAAW